MTGNKSVIKFIWYSTYANYIQIDDDFIQVNMKKKDMKRYAENMGVEFINKSW